MKSKEKAKELVGRFYPLTYEATIKPYNLYNDAKRCALIAVDEMLKSPSKVGWLNEEEINFSPYFDYWQEVKQEIEKL